MTIADDQVLALGRRLGMIEELLRLTQQLVQPLMTEGMIERMGPTDVALTRELLSVLKAVMQGLRLKSTDATTAEPLTVGQAAAAYVASQQIAGLLGNTTRKTTAMLAGQIEGVDIPQAMKDGWESGLVSNLADIDSLLAQLPDEK